ncbi:hypothetical protein [Desulfosediminicola sp.]|uniref:hypothetical protein n=1 Tax=Desulfosediminicola sp. TaxID=2886825 RepID=UPI003AF27B7F
MLYPSELQFLLPVEEKECSGHARIAAELRLNLTGQIQWYGFLKRYFEAGVYLYFDMDKIGACKAVWRYEIVWQSLKAKRMTFWG